MRKLTFDEICYLRRWTGIASIQTISRKLRIRSTVIFQMVNELGLPKMPPRTKGIEPPEFEGESSCVCVKLTRPKPVFSEEIGARMRRSRAYFKRQFKRPLLKVDIVTGQLIIDRLKEVG